MKTVTRHIKLDEAFDKKIVKRAEKEQRTIHNMLIVLLTNAMNALEK